MDEPWHWSDYCISSDWIPSGAGLKNRTLRSICDVKRRTLQSIKVWYTGYPKEFTAHLKYICTLKFNENLNYQWVCYLRSLHINKVFRNSFHHLDYKVSFRSLIGELKRIDRRKQNGEKFTCLLVRGSARRLSFEAIPSLAHNLMPRRYILHSGHLLMCYMLYFLWYLDRLLKHSLCV